jgi:fermentation-respiration switch protein FrsA (DUF1100 family)
MRASGSDPSVVRPRPLRPGLVFRRMAVAVLVAAAALASGLAALIATVSSRTTAPPWYEYRGPSAGLRPLAPGAPFSHDPLTDLGLPYLEVSFPTAEGMTLRGWLVSPAPGAVTGGIGVVAAHGRGGDRRDLLAQTAVFARLGATTLLFDFRDHGASDGAARGMSMGYREAADVSAAVRYLKGVGGVQRVVVVGVSLGGASAVLAAAADPAIDGVVAEGTMSSFEAYLADRGEVLLARRPGGRLLAALPPVWPRLVTAYTAWRAGAPRIVAPVDVIERIAPRPLLLIQGTADEYVGPAHAQRLYARAGSPKELWLVPGATHGQAFAAAPEEYRERIAALLASLPAGPGPAAS